MTNKDTQNTESILPTVENPAPGTSENVDRTESIDVVVEDRFAGIDPSLRMNSLHKVKRSVRQLPPLPGTMHELLAELQNVEADIKWLEERISSDPSLATRLLKIANSSFYSVQSEVVSISRALMTLGFRTSLNVILAASVRSAFRNVGNIPGFEPGGLIRHSVATGICAVALGNEFKSLDTVTERLFVSGLLHDIGRVAMSPLFNAAASEFQLTCPSGCPSPADERAVLGIDHLEVGQMVIKQWKLPDELQSPIERHHDPISTLHDEPLTLAIVVADLFLHEAGYARFEADEPGMHLDAAIAALGGDRQRVDKALTDFEQQTDAFLGALA